MRPLKQRVSVTLDGDMIEQIKALAEACDRSFSQYINLILKQYLGNGLAENEISKMENGI